MGGRPRGAELAAHLAATVALRHGTELRSLARLINETLLQPPGLQTRGGGGGSRGPLAALEGRDAEGWESEEGEDGAGEDGSAASYSSMDSDGAEEDEEEEEEELRWHGSGAHGADGLPRWQASLVAPWWPRCWPLFEAGIRPLALSFTNPDQERCFKAWQVGRRMDGRLWRGWGWGVVQGACGSPHSGGVGPCPLTHVLT